MLLAGKWFSTEKEISSAYFQFGSGVSYEEEFQKRKTETVILNTHEWQSRDDGIRIGKSNSFR